MPKESRSGALMLCLGVHKHYKQHAGNHGTCPDALDLTNREMVRCSGRTRQSYSKKKRNASVYFPVFAVKFNDKQGIEHWV